MEVQAGSGAASSYDFLCAGACDNNREEETDEHNSHVEWPGISSDEADECVSSVYAYQKGEVVEVFSHTAEGWVEGRVVDPAIYGFHTVEFTIADYGCTLFRKHVLPTSQMLRSPPRDMNLHSSAYSTELEEYDPGCTFISEFEARSALDDFVISFQSSDLPQGRLTEVLHLDYKRNNAFKASRKGSRRGGAFNGPFSIAYKPQPDVENGIVDVVLKVHALPALEDPDRYELYQPVSLHNFVHTLLHHKGEKVYFNPIVPGRSFFLGFTVNKDLSMDLCEKMQADENSKAYYDGLLRRFKDTWNERGDAEGKQLAEEADYLISYTGKNKEVNEDLLKKITTQCIDGPHGRRPITFCTDRSLGFGVHFHQQDVRAGKAQVVALCLGKHGFAQPTAGNGWWEEYKNAAHKTKYGILVLNPSPEYFDSKACVQEWRLPERKGSQCRLWVYTRLELCPWVYEGDLFRIIRARDYVKNAPNDIAKTHQLFNYRNMAKFADAEGVGAIDPKVLRDLVDDTGSNFDIASKKGRQYMRGVMDIAMKAYEIHSEGTEESAACLAVLRTLLGISRAKVTETEGDRNSKRSERSLRLISMLDDHLGQEEKEAAAFWKQLSAQRDIELREADERSHRRALPLWMKSMNQIEQFFEQKRLADY